MKQLIRPAQLLTIGGLVTAWCGLWRTLSLANVASGLVIAFAIVASGVAMNNGGGLRPVPLVRLAGLVAVDLARSTIGVAHEILTPTDHTEEAIIAIHVPGCRDHLLLLVVAITLTPGTAVVDTDPETDTLYLHLLHNEGRDATVIHVKRLARLAALALPSPKVGAAP